MDSPIPRAEGIHVWMGRSARNLAPEQAGLALFMNTAFSGYRTSGGRKGNGGAELSNHDAIGKGGWEPFPAVAAVYISDNVMKGEQT